MKADPSKSRSPLITVRRGLSILVITFLTVLIPGTPLSAQQGPSETHRKAVQKLSPDYPAMAKTLRLSGTVKVAVKVAPNGKVMSAEALGGHPLFTQSAVNAVRQWRFEAARQETDEVVYITFQP